MRETAKGGIIKIFAALLGFALASWIVASLAAGVLLAVHGVPLREVLLSVTSFGLGTSDAIHGDLGVTTLNVFFIAAAVSFCTAIVAFMFLVVAFFVQLVRGKS